MNDSNKDIGTARLINALLGRVDVNGLLDEIEINQLLDRVDVNRLLDNVDVDRLLDHVDVNRLLDNVDVDRLLDHVDVDRLLDHVDVNRLLDRVDVNRLVQRVDVPALTTRAPVGELVARGTTEVAGSTLNVVRRQAVGLDTLLVRFVDRVLGRDPGTQPEGPPELVPPPTNRQPAETPSGRAVMSGFYAGPVSRLLAYLIDSSVSFTGFGIIAGGLVTVINAVFGSNLEWDWQAGLLGLGAFSIWLFLYFWVGVAIAGKTLGMAVVGVQVVSREGQPVMPGRAALRVLTLPISIISILGLLGIIFDRDQRALHDYVAGTAVVYDWGDRPAELPAPLSKWLSDRGADRRVRQ